MSVPSLSPLSKYDGQIVLTLSYQLSPAVMIRNSRTGLFAGRMKNMLAKLTEADDVHNSEILR